MAVAEIRGGPQGMWCRHRRVQTPQAAHTDCNLPEQLMKADSNREINVKGARNVNKFTLPKLKYLVFHIVIQKALEKKVLTSKSYKCEFKSWLCHMES